MELYGVGSHDAQVDVHLEDGVPGEEAPLHTPHTPHCLGDGDKVVEVFLNLLHVLLDFAPRSLPPTKYISSSMRSVSTVGGASRAGTVSSLLPGTDRTLACENASEDT